MENPKVRIESDGHITEVYIDGKKVDRATMIDFHAEPNSVVCKYEKYIDFSIEKEHKVLNFDKE